MSDDEKIAAQVAAREERRQRRADTAAARNTAREDFQQQLDSLLSDYQNFTRNSLNPARVLCEGAEDEEQADKLITRIQQVEEQIATEVREADSLIRKIKYDASLLEKLDDYTENVNQLFETANRICNDVNEILDAAKKLGKLDVAAVSVTPSKPKAKVQVTPLTSPKDEIEPPPVTVNEADADMIQGMLGGRDATQLLTLAAILSRTFASEFHKAAPASAATPTVDRPWAKAEVPVFPLVVITGDELKEDGCYYPQFIQYAQKFANFCSSQGIKSESQKLEVLQLGIKSDTRFFDIVNTVGMDTYSKAWKALCKDVKPGDPATYWKKVFEKLEVGDNGFHNYMVTFNKYQQQRTLDVGIEMDLASQWGYIDAALPTEVTSGLWEHGLMQNPLLTKDVFDARVAKLHELWKKYEKNRDSSESKLPGNMTMEELTRLINEVQSLSKQVRQLSRKPAHNTGSAAPANPTPAPATQTPPQSTKQYKGHSVMFPDGNTPSCSRCAAPWPCTRNHSSDTCTACGQVGHQEPCCFQVHPELKGVFRRNSNSRNHSAVCGTATTTEPERPLLKLTGTSRVPTEQLLLRNPETGTTLMIQAELDGNADNALINESVVAKLGLTPFEVNPPISVHYGSGTKIHKQAVAVQVCYKGKNYEVECLLSLDKTVGVSDLILHNGFLCQVGITLKYSKEGISIGLISQHGAEVSEGTDADIPDVAEVEVETELLTKSEAKPRDSMDDDQIESEDAYWFELPQDLRLWTIEELDSLINDAKLKDLPRYFGILNGKFHKEMDLSQCLLLLDVWMSAQSRYHHSCAELPLTLQLLLTVILRECKFPVDQRIFKFIPISLVTRVITTTLIEMESDSLDSKLSDMETDDDPAEAPHQYGNKRLEEISLEFPHVFDANHPDELRAIDMSQYVPNFADTLKPFYHQPIRLGALLDRIRTNILDDFIRKGVLERVTKPATEQYVHRCFLKATRRTDSLPEGMELRDLKQKVTVSDELLTKVLTLWKFKLVIDYRAINAQTIMKRHPLPVISEVLRTLYDGMDSSKLLFASADGSSFYQCLEIHPDYRHYFDFADTKSIFRTKRLQYGLVDAPGVCTMLVSRLVSNLKQLINQHQLRINLTSYMDDIFWSSDRMEDLEKFQRLLLTEVSNMGVTLSSAKLKVGLTELEALGHKLTRDGISPSHSSVLKLAALKVPKNAKEAKQTLGFAQWIAEHIPSFSNIVAPIISATKPEVWTWNDECDAALERLKAGVIPVPLSPFTYGLDTVLTTDASPTAIAFALSQLEKKTGWKPVLFDSRVLKDPETRYQQGEREALAACWALSKAEMYLRYTPFILRSDNRPLVQAINNTKETNTLASPRWKRFIEYIRTFPVIAEWIPGETMGMDIPSRMPVFHQSKPISQEELDFHDLATKILNGRLVGSKRLRKKIRKYGRIENGTLYFKSCRVPPKSDRPMLLKEAHKDHQGVGTMLQSLQKQRLYWPSLPKDVKSFICLNCAANTAVSLKERLRALRGTGFLQHLSIDWLGPYGPGYVLNITDTFAGLTYLFLNHKIDQEFAAAAVRLLGWFLGEPEVITADNAFSDKLTKFLNSGTVMDISPPNSPTYNSFVERSNRMVDEHIKRRGLHISNSLTQADLWDIQLKINSTPRKALGSVSPLEALLGRELGAGQDSGEPKPTPPAHLIERWRKDMMDHLKFRSFSSHNARVWGSDRIFEVGDLVMVKSAPKGKTEKASNIFDGPFVVVTAEDGVIVVRDPYEKYKRVAANQIKPLGVNVHFTPVPDYEVSSDDPMEPIAVVDDIKDEDYVEEEDLVDDDEDSRVDGYDQEVEENPRRSSRRTAHVNYNLPRIIV